MGSRPFVLNCSKVNPELPKRRLVVFRPIDSEPFLSVSSPLNIDSQTSCLPLWQHGAVGRMSVSMSTHLSSDADGPEKFLGTATPLSKDGTAL